ncbi:MAG: type II/IV secretion system protein [Bacteroidetes bacterium]|nr:type II/IV secretion system protein [Bacteroidota bacterium]
MDQSDYIKVELKLLQILTTNQAWHYCIIPKSANNGNLSFYIDKSKYRLDLVNELELLFGKTIDLELSPSAVIQRSLGKYYLKENTTGNNSSQNISILNGGEDFLVSLIKEAKNLGSSDIHIEAFEETCRVRIRIDGVLIERYIIEKEDYPGLVNKIKISSNLDISEKRLPQDGRIFFNEQDEKFDIRVSILPTLYGEKVVLRLLSNDASSLDINTLGFSKTDLENYLEGIKKPHGIVLISGPTGSGKTTTLYATLKILNNYTTNILTIEDPIEYTLYGINQVQLKENIGLDFARALKTFLRQDPDIIMVGEIRDKETASMAVRASLTGHLVLSTIHTNSAWGSIARLIDMGIPPFLIANTLNLSVAQRLVRLLCFKCKKKTKLGSKMYPKNFKPKNDIKEHYTPIGCDQCFYTGYKSRQAIIEVIPINVELTEKIKSEELDVTEYLEKIGVKTLSNHAFELFSKGQTSLEEVYPILLNN